MKWGISIGLSLILIFTMFQSEAVAPTFQKGVNIDVARKDYSLETLKKIVDTIARYEGDYLQLHFADDQHYAIAFHDMSSTKRETLSYKEIKALIKYSNDRDVMIVPDIEFPSHAGALLQHLKKQDRETYEAVVSEFSENTVDYFDNQRAVKWSQQHMKKVMSLFAQPKYQGEQRIVIGGDEVPGAMAHQKSFVHYMNQLAETAQKEGYQPQIWNDSLTKQGIQMLDPNVSVLFWRQHKETHQQQAHVKDLAKAAIPVFNYNAQTLYFLPASQHSEEAIQKQQQFIERHYAENRFNVFNDAHHVVAQPNIQGSALSFWGEHADELSQQEMLQQMQPLIQTYLTRN
ncbi:family 20 glycosylhydrolase [Staphylococcus intermedius]|nr:family 20 glycosylhydrolase [Staphylococcus intermedius]PCF64114.1 beta-hexosaminidase [Staphylococcus intermedius]PCF78829.1 beta-hexosaminidase [Staphylococcus intermedius]PCF79802.1 beta-hexosaminidase [Staphylococcus intermedius]PCF85017.1 beta-hexosaminidase [Staphylococcus intermedius]PCF89539.1 beta-hexosaminidase [Staphylococcus intermedius]